MKEILSTRVLSSHSPSRAHLPLEYLKRAEGLSHMHSSVSPMKLSNNPVAASSVVCGHRTLHRSSSQGHPGWLSLTHAVSAMPTSAEGHAKMVPWLSQHRNFATYGNLHFTTN